MHELDFTKGAPAIAYRGNVPWHGYGEHIEEEDLPLDEWQRRAGLDYTVVRKPVFCSVFRDLEENDEEERSERARNILNYKKVPNKVALLRSDTHDMLSVVSNRYKVVQPAEVLEFFDDLIKKNGFIMHTAGALRDGKRVWALAETGKDFTIDGDTVAAYLLLATSYDGTFATTAQFTSIRVVCNNTLSWSLEGSEHQSDGVIKIPHNQEFSDVEVKLGLGLDVNWEKFKLTVEKLARTQVSPRQALEFFTRVLSVSEEEVDEGAQNFNLRKLMAFYESGPGSDLDTAKGTAWGLVNAVSFFTDHSMRSKNSGTRFDSASFGGGARLKRKALTYALEIANS